MPMNVGTRLGSYEILARLVSKVNHRRG
jgi:hypothetical protein